MKLIRNGSELPLTILKSDYYNTNIGDYFLSLEYVSEGRYMIKKLSLKIHGWDYLLIDKMYFCDASTGISFSSDKDNRNIFYMNNHAKIYRLAKYLAANSSDLFIVVDRVTASEEYILSKSFAKNEHDIIIN